LDSQGHSERRGNGEEYIITDGLIVIDGKANSVFTVPISSMPAWARDGWEVVSASNGQLRFLIGGEHPGVMAIGGDGKIVDAKELSGKMSAIGSRAILVTPEGKISETIDAGRTWQDVEPLPGGADSVPRCMPGGCEVGPWYRLGWGRGQESVTR